jgi:hypothetical protein
MGLSITLPMLTQTNFTQSLFEHKCIPFLIQHSHNVTFNEIFEKNGKIPNLIVFNLAY